MKYNNKSIIGRNKKNIIKELFNDVSKSYDLMNDIMSLGLHRIWKRDLIKKIKKEKAEVILDLAGGTGDISIYLAKYFSNSSIYLYDLSFEMISYGKKYRKALYQNLFYINGSADQIAFKDNSVDIISIAFGLRNFSNTCVPTGIQFRIYSPKIFANTRDFKFLLIVDIIKVASGFIKLDILFSAFSTSSTCSKTSRHSIKSNFLLFFL